VTSTSTWTAPGRLLGPVVVGVTAAAVTLLVAVVDPERPGHYPVCPTYALTGFYCPGCGGLRAVHALTHGEFGLALHRNPLVVLGLPLVAWAYLAWLRRRALDRPVSWLPPRALGVAIAGLLGAFTVLRNLPAFSWLAP
jgi:Protein of unknown function (DUF2752)